MAQLGLGYGNKGFGGGSLVVVRAVAIDGQTIRVVFNQQPVARSPIGTTDATNITNYRVAILAPGVGTSPSPVGVLSTLVQGPAYGPVQAGQWAVDIKVDRPLLSQLTYSITVSNVAASSGDVLGTPVTGVFLGVVLLHPPTGQTQDLSNVDLATDIATGAFSFTSSGDIDRDGGLAGLKKRILRRLGTPKNAFRFLPGYGAALALKKPYSVGTLASFRTDLLLQVKREPEVADASVSATLQSFGTGSIVTVTVNARTRAGLTLNLQASQTEGGSFTVSG